MEKQLEKSSIEIKLNRLDRVYRPMETVEGRMVMNAYKGWGHSGVNMLITGVVHCNNMGRGITNEKDPTSKPIVLMKQEQQLCPSGKFNDGVTEVPFQFQVKQYGAQGITQSKCCFFSIII